MNNSRALIILFILILAFFALVTKLFNVQVLDHDHYAELAKNQQDKSLVIKAERGSIKDRNGEILSYTQDDVSFFVDTRMLGKVKREKVAEKFSEVFGKSRSHYLRLMNSKSGNVFIEKKAPREKAIKLKSFIVDGLVTVESPSRMYSNGSLASHILGYVNSEMIGIDGIERVYDNYLKGDDGLLYVERDVQGRIVTVLDEMSRKPVSGDDVVLTINAKYQRILEKELNAGIKKCGAKWGIGILMDPNTGEIVALANYPTFNPAKYYDYSDNERRNRALTDTYEPGSTMKAVTMSMLLDQNLADPDERINTEHGSYRIANARISDVHKNDYLTVKEILEESSNVGMTKLSTRIDERTFYKYLRDFGFGNSTSINLPSESSGFLKKPNAYSKLSKPFMSFGYEISVTPLQMITAFSAIINGGILVEPRIIDQIVSPTGEIIKQFDTKRIRRVIDESTSAQMRKLLLGVVENGTGKLARVNNMLIGGKTGTAQKFIDGRYLKDYNASFIGFFPADKPQLVGLILISSPKTGKYGGVVAAPVFQKVTENIIESDINIVPEQIQVARKEETIDQILKYISSSDSPVFLQTANVPNIMEEQKEYEESINRVTMPNLMHKSIRDALAQLNNMGLRYDVKGNGRIVYQSISPGSTISKGDLCVLKCEANNTLKTIGLN